eukprot:scaffold2898_cov148-Skeletonema_menzelii.AAC.8
MDSDAAAADAATDAALALDRLQITENTNTEEDVAESASSIPDCKPDASAPILLCDAFYGFPIQKRPRNERVRAVSRQLTNFLQWRSEASLNKKNINHSHVYVLGKGKDCESVKARVDELGTQTKASTKEIMFQPDVEIHQFLDQQKRAHESVKEEVVYLSPDATYTLPTTCRPPRIVIVGMLIDRRITEDRSRRRAEESLNIRAAKLPLDELRVKELSSCEPLNVDTVMELMQRWWWNCDRVEERLQQINGGGKTEGDSNAEKYSQLYKKCFIEAAAYAMKSQRDRHPNRTVHKTE